MSGYRNNSAFLLNSKLQWAWDSVSIGVFKECPRKYELSIIEGWHHKSESVHLKFGILLHSARERFYHLKTTGASHDAALEEALEWLFEATWDFELNRPWQSNDANKNRETLIRTFVWYADEWKDDPLETIILENGKPAVELTFKMESGFSFGSDPILLCGHLDRLVEFYKKPYGSDLKSTKHTLGADYFKSFTPDNQFSLYSFAAPIVWRVETEGLIVDAAQVAVTFTRFERRIIPRTKGQLEEWHQGLGFIFAQAKSYAEQNFWPMNEKACFRCEFRAICSMTPEARSSWLQSDFIQRQWNPLEARGDI